MRNHSHCTVLLVAEGSGGHLIPALQVAEVLAAAGCRVACWYAERPQTAPLVRTLIGPMGGRVEVEPIPMDGVRTLLGRLRHGGRLWRHAQRAFDAAAPDIVVGFGGWISAPVILAARQHRIKCVLHEQNVVWGRTNRLLSRLVDRMAISFHDPDASAPRDSWTLTGLPIREAIGTVSRDDAARAFGLEADRPTVLVLGGSQGARALNRVMASAAAALSAQEQKAWQVVHITGQTDAPMVRQAYAAAGLKAWVAPFVSEMGSAYALADVVLARAGASTIAELARCGLPAVLVPYPYAGGHQQFNARLVEGVGGGVTVRESEATPGRILALLRRIMADSRLRTMMGSQMRSLDRQDAAERLAELVLAVAAG